MLPIGPSLSARPPSNAQEWRRMVREAAYFLAEKRNFAPGSEIEDWLTAEAQVEVELADHSTTSPL